MDELFEMQKACDDCQQAILANAVCFTANMLALQMEVANVDRCRDLPLADREAAVDAVAGLFDCSPRE